MGKKMVKRKSSDDLSDFLRSHLIVVTSTLAIAISVLGLLGYASPALRILGSLRADYIPMAPSTAFSFIIICVLLILFSKGFFRKKFLYPVLLLVAVSVFGFAKYIEYFFDTGTNFEAYIVRVPDMLGDIPIGIMSPSTGILFFLLGGAMISLLFMAVKNKKSSIPAYIMMLFVSIAMVVSTVSFVAYIVGIPFLYNVPEVVPMAITTAISFVLLSAALLSAIGVYVLHKLSIRGKFYGSFLVIMILFVGISVYSMGRIDFLANTVQNTIDHPLAVTNPILLAGESVTAMHLDMKDIVLSEDKATRYKYINDVDSKEKIVLEYFDFVLDNILGDEGVAITLEAKNFFINWKPIRDRVITLMDEGKIDEAQRITRTEGNRYVEQIRLRKLEIREYTSNKSLYFSSVAVVAAAQSSLVIIISIIFISLYSFAVLITLALYITRRLKFVSNVAVKMTRGDLRQEIDVIGGDEIDELASNFNSMAHKLANSYENLEEKVKVRTIELDKAIIRLRELDVLKDQFLNTTSHELKTPLIPIKSQVQLLLSDTYGKLSKKQNAAVEMIGKNEDHMEQLVNDILDIAKVKSNRLKLNLKMADFGKLILDTVEGMRTLAEKEGVNLSLKKIPKLPKISFDSRKMVQVISNLLANSLKFTPKEGAVSMTVEKRINNISITIQDTGIGMSKKTVENTFIPFFQADTELSRKYGGSGLGLAISKGIIEAHGGKIWAESEGENRGSTFTFKLPIKKFGKAKK